MLADPYGAGSSIGACQLLSRALRLDGADAYDRRPHHRAKFAYGYSTANLPFGNLLPHSDHRLFERLPARGDVVVFGGPAHPAITLVKRVIALPGDRIRLTAGHIWLNGREVPWHDDGPAMEELPDGQSVPAERLTEALPDGRTHDVLKIWPTALTITCPN